MKFSSLGACIEFLEKQGELVRIRKPVDPDLEMAQIHRTVFESQGPAVLYERVKGSRFPAVSNLFGTYDRALKILEPELSNVAALIRLKVDPSAGLRSPRQALRALNGLAGSLPKRRKTGAVLERQTTIQDLPMIRCWPRDGGGFILLPQVCSLDPVRPGILHSNLGMYRVQMSGNDYLYGREVGLHYQIHRGIGVHHSKALERGLPLPVSIFVGGPPAHTLAAVMPLPEGMPEVAFAGALAGRRFCYAVDQGSVISLDADFCITGRILPGRTKPEGPFGDHLGYYSLTHEFPVLEVDQVFHRKNAVWPFTVVGRPPQEDSVFGRIIHDLAGPAVPDTVPGVTAVHAVDAAGVHPLLLAKAHERYVPYEGARPRELLTVANAILGSGQLSLAKYLIILSHEDNPELDIASEPDVFGQLLQRIDFSRDLHFQTCTTLDTLDYSSGEINQGSKLILAAAGPRLRRLATRLPDDCRLPGGFSNLLLAGPGIAVVQAPAFQDYEKAAVEIERLCQCLEDADRYAGLPLMVVVDDAQGAAADFDTFLWVTFSRSNPSHDVYGVGSFTRFKHWGCTGSLVIDARIKPFHAPVLEVDRRIERAVLEMGRPGGDLHGII